MYECCKKRPIPPPICGIINDTDFKDDSIDGICFFDVLEHIEKDKDFLQLVYKKLKKNKNILITVPAFPMLWSSEDEYLKHFRRYKRKELEKLVESVGFKVEDSSYFFSFLFAPILLLRVLAEKFGFIHTRRQRTKEEAEKITKREFITKKGLVSKSVDFLCNIERQVLKKTRIPFGSSIILSAKKI